MCDVPDTYATSRRANVETDQENCWPFWTTRFYAETKLRPRWIILFANAMCHQYQNICLPVNQHNVIPKIEWISRIANARAKYIPLSLTSHNNNIARSQMTQCALSYFGGRHNGTECSFTKDSFGSVCDDNNNNDGRVPHIGISSFSRAA